jgi:hypothetical protein
MSYISAAMFRAIGFVSRVDGLKFIKQNGIRKTKNEDPEKYLQRVNRVRIDEKKNKREIKMTMMNLQKFLSQDFTTYSVHREINEVQQSENLTVYFDDMGDLYDDIEIKTKKYKVYDNQIKKIYKFTEYEIDYDYPFETTYKKIKRVDFNGLKKIKLNFIDLMDEYMKKNHRENIKEKCKSIFYIKFEQCYNNKIRIQRVIKYGTNFYNTDMEYYTFCIKNEGDIYLGGEKIEEFYNHKEYLQQIYILLKNGETDKMRKILLGQQSLEYKKYWSINDVEIYKHNLVYFNYKLFKDYPLILTPLKKFINEDNMTSSVLYYSHSPETGKERFTISITDYTNFKNNIYNLNEEKVFMKNYKILKKNVGFMYREFENLTVMDLKNRFDKILKFNPVQVMALIGGPFNNDVIGEIAKFLIIV